jgi:hypothetical protein
MRCHKTIVPQDQSNPDPFDPAALRLGQDFAASAGVERVLTTVPCRKPNRHEFIRVRPGKGWRLETAILEDKRNQDKYVVHGELQLLLTHETNRVWP